MDQCTTLPQHAGMCYVNSFMALTGDLVHVTSTYVDVLRSECFSANLQTWLSLRKQFITYKLQQLWKISLSL